MFRLCEILSTTFLFFIYLKAGNGAVCTDLVVSVHAALLPLFGAERK